MGPCIGLSRHLPFCGEFVILLSLVKQINRNIIIKL